MTVITSFALQRRLLARKKLSKRNQSKNVRTRAYTHRIAQDNQASTELRPSDSTVVASSTSAVAVW